MKLIVGLGNPGSSYEGTRHNVGFEVLAELGMRWRVARPKRKFEAELQDAVFQDQKIVLAAPQTFMNLSGRSIQQVVQFYQIPFGDILVVCDDMNLKLGQLRLRPTGSAGGQKGLQSILQVCGTEGIPRLRIGVGRPPEQMDVSAYVLSKFRKDEVPQIDNSIRNAASGIEIWIRDGTAAAMNVMNPLLTDPKDGHPKDGHPQDGHPKDGQGEGKKK